MGSSALSTPTVAEFHDHWTWRPEWTPERTCLYWYLTFREDDISAILGEDVLQLVRDVSWLDAVPPRWCHVTVTDVGFTDDLQPLDVEAVTAAVADAVAGADRLRLTLGPVHTLGSAVVLTAGPLHRLRRVKAQVRRATRSALGPRHADVHRNVFWPHLSLGYVNRAVDAAAASRFLQAVPEVSASVGVDALTLAAVTRRGHGYRWEVEAEVQLIGDAAATDL